MQLVEQIAAISKDLTTIEILGIGSWLSVYIENVLVDVQLSRRIGQELLVEMKMSWGKRRHQLSFNQRQSSTEHRTVAMILTCAMNLEKEEVA